MMVFESDKFARGSNQSGLRAYNERLVLSLLRRHGALAKAAIAQMTGLSAQTVSVIVRELEHDGLLCRGARTRVQGKVGQPSVPMSLNPDGAFFYGLKLGRRSADLVLIDFLGTERYAVHETYAYPTPERALAFTREAIAEIESSLPQRISSRIAGLGIGMPFYLWHWADSVGAPQSVMDAWREVDMRESMQAMFEFPVYLQNDATAACGAELAFGDGELPRNFLYVYFGYFIGGGVVINGNLFPGTNGNSGAIAPVLVPDGDNGLVPLIDVASLSVLEQRLRENGTEWRSMWDSADEWAMDAQALSDWVDAAARGLAYACHSAISLIDLDAVVIDGWLPRQVRHELVALTDRHLDSLDLTGLEKPLIREGVVGPRARALGAASLPLSLRFMADPDALLKH